MSTFGLKVRLYIGEAFSYSMMMVMQFTTLLSLLMALLAVITSVAGNLTALLEGIPVPKNVDKVMLECVYLQYFVYSTIYSLFSA